MHEVQNFELTRDEKFMSLRMWKMMVENVSLYQHFSQQWKAPTL
jgi:hypothetical protein